MFTLKHQAATVKNSLLALTFSGFLAGCDVPNLTSSGGDSAQTLASAEATAGEAQVSDTKENTEVAQSSKPVETPPEEVKSPSPPPPPPPPPPVA